jgi:hypothetical protein
VLYGSWKVSLICINVGKSRHLTPELVSGLLWDANGTFGQWELDKLRLTFLLYLVQSLLPSPPFFGTFFYFLSPLFLRFDTVLLFRFSPAYSDLFCIMNRVPNAGTPTITVYSISTPDHPIWHSEHISKPMHCTAWHPSEKAILGSSGNEVYLWTIE